MLQHKQKITTSVEPRRFVVLWVVLLTLCCATVTAAKTFDAQFPEELLATRLNRIAEKGSVTILSDLKLIGTTRVSALKVTNLTVEQVLERSLSGTTFTWKKTTETSYAVLKKNIAQQPPVKQTKSTKLLGKITDENGEALPGANILVADVNKSFITDVNGNFSIDLQPGTHKIIVSYVSYKKQMTNIVIKNGVPAQLNISLKPDNANLGEVVVMARRKENTEIALLQSRLKS